MRQLSAKSQTPLFKEFESCLFEFPIMMWNSDPEGKRIFFNRSWLDFTGCALEQGFGNGWVKFLHQDDRDLYRKRYFKAVQAKEPFELEFRLQKADSQFRTIIENGKPIYQDDNLIGYVGICFDITNQRELEKTLRKENEEIYSSFYENNHSVIILVDPDTGRLVDANKAACKFYGYSKEKLTQKNIGDLNMLSNKEVMQKVDLIKKRKIKLINLQHKLANGEIRDIEAYAGLINAYGKTLLYGIINDITEQKKAEARIIDAYAELNQIFNSTANGMRVVDTAFNIIKINRTMLENTGITEKEAIGKKCYEVLPGSCCKTPECPLIQIKNGKKKVEYETVKISPDGNKIPYSITVTPLKNPNGELFAVIEDFKDLTEIKKNEEKIKQIAYHDQLTKLPNRLYFVEKLNSELNGRDNTKLLAVMFFDLDEFKYVNDNYGHTIGNKVLVYFAKRLKSLINEDDFIARLGGDEFTILLSRINDIDDIRKMADFILREFERPFTIDGIEIYLSLSIGISIFPTDGTDSETIIKNADIAMYHAKDNGKNSFKFFETSNQNYYAYRLNLENHLRNALKQNELELYYQPQIDTNTNRIRGVEALIRWNSFSLGSIPPNKFIPVAEETGLINSIGKWVMLTACTQSRMLEEQGLPPIIVGINLSVKQLADPDLIDNINEIIKMTGINPSNLEIEITESVALNNFEDNIIILNKIKEMGIQIALDDFGTGYSSLFYLKKLPIDVLKIDKTFVHDLTADPRNMAIAKAIISMARNLKLKVIAEGVESKEQLDFLKSQKCDVYQGFLFSKPLPIEDLKKLLTASFL